MKMRFSYNKYLRNVLIIITVIGVAYVIPKPLTIKNTSIIKSQHKVAKIQKTIKYYQHQIKQLKSTEDGLRQEISRLNKQKEESIISRGVIDRGMKVKVSFYDLSIQSCGKRKNHPAYGITRTGYNLKGKDWRTARTIATDPKVIPMNSTVRIVFANPYYQKYNGIYISRDTGSMIVGRKIDFFYEDCGEQVSENAMRLGVTEAFVEIIK